MKWMNLPTGEVIVAPVENMMQGKLVCDLAVGGIGKVKHPVEVEVKNGKVESVFCKNKQHLTRIKQTFATDEWADVVGEFAFGINPKARFVTNFGSRKNVWNNSCCFWCQHRYAQRQEPIKESYGFDDFRAHCDCDQT